MNRDLRVCVTGLLVAAVVSACHQGGPPGAESAQPNADVLVYVDNHYATSMDVYVLGAGTVQRLGVVNAGTTRSFVVPPVMVGTGVVQFRAQPTGYGPITDTDPVVLHGSHVVDFEITTNLIGSHAAIRL